MALCFFFNKPHAEHVHNLFIPRDYKDILYSEQLEQHTLTWKRFDTGCKPHIKHVLSGTPIIPSFPPPLSLFCSLFLWFSAPSSCVKCCSEGVIVETLVKSCTHTQCGHMHVSPFPFWERKPISARFTF